MSKHDNEPHKPTCPCDLCVGDYERSLMWLLFAAVRAIMLAF